MVVPGTSKEPVVCAGAGDVSKKILAKASHGNDELYLGDYNSLKGLGLLE